MPLAPWIEELARLSVTTRLRRIAATARTTPSRAARWPSSSRRRSTAPRRPASSSRRRWGPKDSEICGVLGVGYLPWLAVAVLAAGLDLPGPEPRAGQRRPRAAATAPARRRRTAGATTTRRIPLYTTFFTQRPLPARPAAPARLLRAPQDRRRLDEHDHAAEPVHPVPEHPGQQRLRQLPRHPRRTSR